MKVLGRKHGMPNKGKSGGTFPMLPFQIGVKGSRFTPGGKIRESEKSTWVNKIPGGK